MTAGLPSAQVRSISSAIACSQGQRSSSVSGWPALILATLAGGWKLSPSSNRQPRRLARQPATVLLPEPDTPITTSAQGIAASATKLLRKRGLIHQPDGLALGSRAVRRQVLA